jgi:hypothetical protein
LSRAVVTRALRH